MLYGVVEGFYGKPYSARQRRILIRYLSLLDKAAFVYAPKNDPFHRLRWREDYPAENWSQLSETIDTAVGAGLEFIFGISPWQFNTGDSDYLRKKAGRAVDVGASGIAVLFDDIPERADASLAVRQFKLAREALNGFDCMIYLCPSIYCLELMEKYDGDEYLSAWRDNVPCGWKSFWTGNGVISRELDENIMTRARELLGGKPVIWDNLLADDYSLRRIYLAGLQDRIPDEYSYFLNPSSCFPVALHAVYMLLQASGVSCDWPSELGDMPQAWDILSGFHYLPWHAGKATEYLLLELENAASGGPSEQLITKLRSMSGVLARFIDSLEGIEGGFEMMPYIMDVKKIIGWWEEVLKLPSRPERISRLEYLMFERLPFDHPLALITAELSMKSGRGE
ncbi:MAG: beta-N-acetylglucosaminidase domain-containing protein [Candidatus Aegiribacteria sp.]|nr:beta-N-acetylglucosaminidase domain-containing protein [Candidatus Aegiribacteria sp.]